MNRVVNTICASLLSIFLASCAGKTPPIIISSTDMLTDDCAIMRNFLSSQDGKVIKVDKEFIGFSDLCKNHQLTSMLIDAELKNPDLEVRAVFTAAVVKMLAEASPEFKSSMLVALEKYKLTEEDLIARKELDDAIQKVKDTPEVDCVEIRPKQFICE